MNYAERDGIINHEDSIYIPKEMRNKQLIGAHNGHKKFRAMRDDLKKRKAWWPDIVKDMKSFIKKCGHCLMNQPLKTSSPPQLPDKGDRQWGCITSDFFQIDRTTFFHITCRLTNKSIVYECRVG